MTITKNSIILLSLFSICTFLLFSETGCSPDNSAYITRIDSLNHKLEVTEKLLSIDYNTIQVRKKLIEKHMSYVKQYHTDTMTKEFSNSLNKYRGIKKNYSNFLTQYPTVYNELKSLQKQAADLRTSVTKNQISKEEFKGYYKQEMHDADKNLNFAKGLSTSIHSLEPDYQRISNDVYEKLTLIAKTDPRLADRLEADKVE